MNIALLYGGRSFEREISVITAIQLADFFPQEYNLIPVYMNNGDMMVIKDFKFFKSYESPKGKKVDFIKNGIKCGARKIKIDCALVATHGGEGENGTLSSLFEYYDIPYTACDHYCAAASMDKFITKSILDACGFKTAKTFTESVFPCIVKPRRLGSSIGVRVARNEKELSECLEFARGFDEVIIEEYLENAKEYNCAAVQSEGNIIVSAVERPYKEGDFLNFDDKYVKSAGRELPAEIDEELTGEIKDITEKIYRAFGCFGVVRVDYLLSQKGELIVNEINSIPGSLAFYLFESEGISYEKLLRMLIEEGMRRGVKTFPDFSTDILKKYAEGGFGAKCKK